MPLNPWRRRKPMTRERKAEFPLTVRQAGPGRFWRESGILSLIGALLVLAVPVPGARAMEGQPDWVEEISLAGAVIVTAVGVSRSEANKFLEGFGLTAGAVADPEIRTYQPVAEVPVRGCSRCATGSALGVARSSRGMAIGFRWPNWGAVSPSGGFGERSDAAGSGEAGRAGSGACFGGFEECRSRRCGASRARGCTRWREGALA